MSATVEIIEGQSRHPTPSLPRQLRARQRPRKAITTGRSARDGRASKRELYQTKTKLLPSCSITASARASRFQRFRHRATCAQTNSRATLQDNAVEPASPSELISTSPVLLLAPGEPRAPIAILSPAKRNALVACFNAGGLHKRDGAWHGPPGGKPVSGMTTADLARDGMLTVTTNHRIGSAR
jgi:hypothetical protein